MTGGVGTDLPASAITLPPRDPNRMVVREQSIPVVSVTTGLYFRCPYCKADGHRTQRGSDVHEVPKWHESLNFLTRRLVRCSADRGVTRLWWLVFRDVARAE